MTDSHCHLASRRFEGEVDEVVARATVAGVARILVPSTSLDDGPRALSIAERHEGVWVAVGIHPCEVATLPEDGWMEMLDAWSRHEKVVAIGECGLDFFHPPPEGLDWAMYKERQALVFRAQLELAEARGLPVVVHHRGEGCWEAAVAMVRECGGRVRAQFHCYLGSWAEAGPIVEEGHRISFTGVVTYKNAGLAAECARQATNESFFLETDAPYLAPVPHRGRRCEPAMVADTATWIADRRGMSLDQLEGATDKAVRSFFPRMA